MEQVDVLLFLKEALKWLVQVLIEDKTLCDKRIDPLSLNFPRYSVDQQGVLDNIELAYGGMLLKIFSMEHFYEYLDQVIQLGNVQDIKMLM